MCGVNDPIDTSGSELYPEPRTVDTMYVPGAAHPARQGRTTEGHTPIWYAVRDASVYQASASARCITLATSASPHISAISSSLYAQDQSVVAG
jgi:hypothetical protein